MSTISGVKCLLTANHRVLSNICMEKFMVFLKAESRAGLKIARRISHREVERSNKCDAKSANVGILYQKRCFGAL